MVLQVRRLAHGLAAEVRGVDLLRLDAAACEAILGGVGARLTRVGQEGGEAALTHEVMGKPALYASEAVTTRFVDMSAEESQPLLRYLFRHSVDPTFTYRHAWHVDDVVMWDNRCAMHLALADFDPAQFRTMLRTSVVGPVTGRVVPSSAADPEGLS